MLWTLLVGLAVFVLSEADPLRDPAGGPRTLIPTPGGVEPGSWRGDAGQWLRVLHLSVFPAYPWVLLAPYVFWLTARYPLQGDRGTRWRRAGIWLGSGLAWGVATSGFRHLTDRVRPDMIVFAFVEATDERARTADPGGDATSTNRGTSTTWMAFHAPSEGLPPRPASAVLSNLLSRVREREGSPGSSGGTSATEGETLVVLREVETVGSGTREASASPPPESVPLTNRFSDLRRDLEYRREALRLPLGRIGGRVTAMLLDLFAFGSLAGIAHAWHYQRRYRERERRALALESSLSRARLHALQAQLQPHFLFNTLNSVTAMLRENPRAAEEMLVSLSDLLRLALSQSSRQECTLREDLRFVELYVEIQQYRFGARLVFEADVEPSVWNYAVPTLLLQPLVENAIRHGLEPAGRRVAIRIRGRATAGGGMELTVEDDGVGSVAPAEEHHPRGVGLANVRARLEAFFGGAASLRVSSPPGGSGFRVQLDLPARPAGDVSQPPTATDRFP